MEKQCEYCAKEFEAKRSDAKYCSASCKQEAYMVRKANPELLNRQSSVVPTDQNYRHNGRFVNSDISISKTELNRLVRGIGTNHEVLNNLLIEKDLTGDIKSDRSKLEIKLMFIERDLKQAQEENASLKAENEKLLDQVEKYSDGSTKITDLLKDPQIAMVFATGCNAIMNKLGMLPGSETKKSNPTKN